MWSFERYTFPGYVGGWLGVLIVCGEPIAFIGLDKQIFFISELG